jgi:hypothetical protein
MMTKPDWKCVFTYVQSFYRRFRNGRDPPPPTRVLIPHPDDQQVRKVDSDKKVSNSLFSEKSDEPLSPEKQKSLLSKYLIDDDDEKRSKNRSTVCSNVRTSSTFSQKSSFPTRQTQQRPPLTPSLSLSSCPDKTSPKPVPARLTSVEETVPETETDGQGEAEKVPKNISESFDKNLATSSDEKTSNDVPSSVSVKPSPPVED